MSYSPILMQIKLTPEESRLLVQAAREQGRDTRQQAAFLVRQGLGLNGPVLSSLGLATLVQVAKDGGLDSLDEAVRFLLFQSLMIQALETIEEEITV